MPAAAKSKESRKAAAIETKPVSKSTKKQKVEEKVVEKVVEEEEDDEEEDADESADDDEDDDEEEDADDDDDDDDNDAEEKVEEAEPEEEEAEGAFKDETLECKDCGNEFVFSSGEQEFYQQKVRYIPSQLSNMWPLKYWPTDNDISSFFTTDRDSTTNL